MKLSHILFILVLFVSTNIQSQKIAKHDVAFDYTQLPLKPLDKTITNYTSSAIIEYEAEILAEERKAQEEFDQALADYPQVVEDAKKNYDEIVAKYEADMKEYKKKSLASKLVEKELLNESSKPIRPGRFYPPSKPYLRVVPHQKVFNAKRLANSYLKLEGFKKSTENAVKITATLFGFDNLEPEQKHRVDSKYNSKTKTNYKVTKYWVEVSYRHPINLLIETPDGEIIVDEILPQFNEYKIAKSKESTSSINAKSFIQDLENKSVQQNMKIINEYINNNYGFVRVNREIEIFGIKKHKKHNYNDYQKAFEFAATGYSLLLSEPESATENINNAIQLWEKALTESDPSNRKARINQKISVLTILNLVEAYIWTNNYSKANDLLIKTVTLDPGRKERKLITSYKEFLKGQKESWDANNN